MAFALTTCDRVMGCLGLPVTVYYVQQVQQSLEHAQTHGGDPAVTRIEGYLTQYEAQELALNSAAGSAGLIKADVLEWSLGGKTSGIKTELGRLRKSVARSLLLEHLVQGTTTVRLIRR